MGSLGCGSAPAVVHGPVLSKAPSSLQSSPPAGSAKEVAPAESAVAAASPQTPAFTPTRDWYFEPNAFFSIEESNASLEIVGATKGRIRCMWHEQGGWYRDALMAALPEPHRKQASIESVRGGRLGRFFALSVIGKLPRAPGDSYWDTFDLTLIHADRLMLVCGGLRTPEQQEWSYLLRYAVENLRYPKAPQPEYFEGFQHLRHVRVGLSGYFPAYIPRKRIDDVPVGASTNSLWSLEGGATKAVRRYFVMEPSHALHRAYEGVIEDEVAPSGELLSTHYESIIDAGATSVTLRKSAERVYQGSGSRLGHKVKFSLRTREALVADQKVDAAIFERSQREKYVSDFRLEYLTYLPEVDSGRALTVTLERTSPSSEILETVGTKKRQLKLGMDGRVNDALSDEMELQRVFAPGKWRWN